MVGTLSRITTLLFATAILLVGHGLQLTFLPLFAESSGWSTSAIGVTGSFYFLGFVVGCIVIPSFVSEVGHIRVFMVMAAIATVTLLGAGLIVHVRAWLLLRFATGFALSGLYMVIESWLNEASAPHQRGTVLAIYTMISLLGMALGQMVFGLLGFFDLRAFVVAAMLMSVAIVPIGLARVASPLPVPAIRFTPRILLRASRVAVVCATLAGMVTGAFWTLGPVLGRAFGLEASQVGLLMGLGVLGGALVQLPVGRLSDRADRRIAIGIVTGFGTVVAALGFWLAGQSATTLYVLIFLLGAAVMPLYALCIAHAADNTELTLVEVTSGVLIVHSAGSILGPIVVAALMDGFGPRSFFAYVSLCLFCAAGWAIHRRFVVERPVEPEAHSAILPRTTQAVAGLSPEETTSLPEADRSAQPDGAPGG